jgi:hypothetical protein
MHMGLIRHGLEPTPPLPPPSSLGTAAASMSYTAPISGLPLIRGAPPATPARGSTRDALARAMGLQADHELLLSQTVGAIQSAQAA